MYYTINKTTNRIDSVGIYPDAGIEASGSEPFTIFDAFDYRFDFETKKFIYDPITMIPQSITPRQGMLLLSRRDQLNIVEQTISNLATIAGDEKLAEEALIEWNKASSWDRSHASVLFIAELLQWSDTDIDDFFVEAAKI